MAKQMAELRMQIRSLEAKEGVKLENMVDFERLSKYFFREKRYSYGKLIRVEEERSSSWESDEE